MNHLDHEKTNFESAVENVHEIFGKKAIIVQYPVNPGLDFNSVVDLLKMKMYKWEPNGGEPQELEIPASEKNKAEELQQALMEEVAGNDETLMEIFFDKGSLTEEEFYQGMKAGVRDRKMFPVFCTAASKNIGIRRLLDFLSNVAPSVTDVPAPKTEKGEEIIPDANGPASLFIFKTSIELLSNISIFTLSNFAGILLIIVNF
jgi:elongation factor G